jgi:hypothetical protein
MNWRALFSKPNPARELALIGHEKQREHVKARARQLCMEIGKPIPEALQ